MFRRSIAPTSSSTARAHLFHRMLAAAAFAGVFGAMTTTPARSAEGQWMPEQIADLDQNVLKKLGLKLSPEQLWDGKGGGVLRGVVNVRGCSGGFVSEKGLVATNHHCAYGALQAASRVTGVDYLKAGLVAQSQSEEVRAPGLWIQVIEQIDDVTAPIRAAADAASSTVERAKAVESKTNALVLKCEKEHKDRRCRIASFDMGARFLQFTTLELRDIRMVFAPPSSLGNFGGEVDNWMWPRHAADVTFVRGYVAKDGTPAEFNADNIPYKSPHVLKVTAGGVDEGSFVMTVGYPGHTQRYLSAGEVERQLDQVFPGIISMYGDWISMQKRLGEASSAKKLKVAARMRSLMNRHKNARGMVAGMQRMKLLDRRRGEDLAIASVDAASKKTTSAMDAIAASYKETFERDVVLLNVRRLLPGIGTAIDLHRRALESSKAESDRVPRYMTRSEAQLWSDIERNLRDYDPSVESTLLADVLKRLNRLTGAQATSVGLGSFATMNAGDIVKDTKLGDPATVKTLFNSKTLAADLARAGKRDRLLALGEILAQAIEKMETEHRDHEGKQLLVGPEYFAKLKAVKKGAVYSDANGTLRFSYAQVRGYMPQDGLYALPQTTLAGAIAKHTDVAPFVLPSLLRERAQQTGDTAWTDGELGDIPVNFLSTSDTTGGNSGSPVLDGEGQLIGFNFDRVWENIAGDFGYHPSRSRNITVDVRYVLWLLDRVYNASALLDELGVGTLRKQTTPVDVAQESVVATSVLAQVAHDAAGKVEVESPTRQNAVIGEAKPTTAAKKDGAKKKTPQNTAAVIIAAILLLGGFALLVARREKE